MRRQKAIHTLPSEDDSLILYDSDRASMISSHYSYAETVSTPIISPEPEALIPYWIYQYPFFQIPAEQFSSIPGFFNPSLTPSSLNSFDNASIYNDEFADIGYITEPPSCSTPYDDEFIFEDYTPYDGSFTNRTSENMSQEVTDTYPIVTNYGTVTILLRHLIRVDISPAKAVYVTNPPANCMAAINGEGDRSCVIHPNGRVLFDGKDIHMATLNRMAKICRRGIIFTSTDHYLSYIVDVSGTKTTTAQFRDLNKDFRLEIFYDDAMASNSFEKCCNMVKESKLKNYSNGDKTWFIGGFRIKQDGRGDVKVTGNGSRHVILTSPTTGQISMKTFSTDILINRYHNNYFVVRKGDKQVAASLRVFNVKNGTQKARFNSCGRVALF